MGFIVGIDRWFGITSHILSYDLITYHENSDFSEFLITSHNVS